jgi:cyclic-di-GMP-binding protein
MLTLSLEPTDNRANPAFRDTAGCLQWLGQLQLTNLHQAHGILRAQLDELNRCPMHGLERLQILELLRETVSFVQADYAKKLIAKKLPLGEQELALFNSIVSLWQGMITGYLRCLQAYMENDAQLASSGALLCQRCLSYSGLKIFEYLRTGYEFSGELWQKLHALYAFSEEKNLHLAACKDELNGALSITCQAVYAKALLACYTRPAELTRGQLQSLDRWLTQWSTEVVISSHRPTGKGTAPPLAVDMASSQGLQPLNQAMPSNSMRYLPTAPLSKLLRVKSVLLQQGQSPQQLGLGEGCTSAECGEFLDYLHQCWCEGRNDRMAERSSTEQHAQVCHGLEAIYAYIANKPFKQPGKGIGTDARKQTTAFGQAASNTSRQNISGIGFALETWQIENESLLGSRLLREGAAGTRVGLHQVVAVRPENAGNFTVGSVSWANVTADGQLRVGIHYLPGTAQAISVKGTSGKYAAALLLPALPALGIPASLLIPRDLFRPGLMMEIILPDKVKQKVKMEFSVERGLDYERVSFTEAV